MPYTKTTWVDEVPASTPVKYSIEGDVEGEISASAVIEVVTTITTPGTPVNATNLNKLEEGVETAQETAEAAIPNSIATAANQLLMSTAPDVWAAVSLSDITYPVHVKITSGQTITFATNTVIPWDSEVFDPKSVFTTGASAKYTAPVTGYYKVDCYLEWTGADDSSSGYSTKLYKNGSLDVTLMGSYGVAANGRIQQTTCKIIQLTAGDYVQIYVAHGDSSGTVQVSNNSYLSISRIG